MPSLTQNDLQAALAQTDGTLKAPCLIAPVTVLRDAHGIPHIRAETASDAWRALGFVHAQDRLFQMELNRRRAVGRSAEWLGPSAAAGDILCRSLGMEAACRRDLAALAPETRSMLDCYVQGINAAIAAMTVPPVEYTLLGASPEPWEAWHPIAVMRRLGLLMGSVWFKLWRAAALPIVGAEGIAKLRYDDAGRDLVCIPPGETATRHAAGLASLRPAIEALMSALAPDDATGGGSNNWAVGPSRSTTGRPILAGDPHRVFEIPNMYAQHHLRCDAFDTIGLTVPGVPGFPHFGHNGSVAWCVTHTFLDIHDVFLERFEDEGAAVLTANGPVPVTGHSGTVSVRGEPDRAYQAFETPHGPVIAGDPKSGWALSLRSVQFAETDRSFDCLPRMLRARDIKAFYEASRGWGLIDHNLVAGDVDGRIGHRVRGMAPRRPPQAGWLPMPGWTAEYDWRGWVPHEAMPEVIDPPEGLIATANNRVVPDDYPEYMGTDCHPPYRAARILEILRSGAFSPDDAAALHADTLSPHVGLFQLKLRDLSAPVSPAAAALRDAVLAWDGHMAADSVGATAYNALRRAMTTILTQRGGLGAVATSPVAAVAPGIVPAWQLWWTLPSLLRQNDTTLLDGWSWADVLTAALEEVARQTPAATGPVPLKPWGDIHRPRLTHPLSLRFPEAAGLLDPPSRPIGGDTDTVLATGIAPATGTAATYGALARYVFDVGAWDNCRWAVFHGASGQPGSPHYADQNAAWSACQMVPMPYSPQAVDAAARHRLRLEP